jgi:hypothetical protein
MRLRIRYTHKFHHTRRRNLAFPATDASSFDQPVVENSWSFALYEGHHRITQAPSGLNGTGTMTSPESLATSTSAPRVRVVGAELLRVRDGHVVDDFTGLGAEDTHV